MVSTPVPYILLAMAYSLMFVIPFLARSYDEHGGQTGIYNQGVYTEVLHE